MFYVFDFRKVKKVAAVLLLLAIAVLLLRFVIIPRYFYPRKFTEQVTYYAQKYNLEESLVYAVIRTESGFDPDAVSVKDARGLMQISQKTGEWGASEIGLENFTVEDLFLPEINIEIGCWYLNRLIHQYDGNADTALAAYNAGSGNVSKWLNNMQYSRDGSVLHEIPFPETKNYVKKVNSAKRIYEKLY